MPVSLFQRMWCGFQKVVWNGLAVVWASQAWRWNMLLLPASLLKTEVLDGA